MRDVSEQVESSVFIRSDAEKVSVPLNVQHAEIQRYHCVGASKPLWWNPESLALISPGAGPRSVSGQRMKEKLLYGF